MTSLTVNAPHNLGVVNAAGRDIYVGSITPEAIRKPVLNILSYLRHKNVAQAQSNLEVLRETANRDANTELVLNTVDLLIKLSSNIDDCKSVDLMALRGSLKQLDDPFCEDILLSALLRLEVVQEKLDDARARFESETNTSSLIQETFFECIATEDEVTQHFEKEKINLDEPVLCGLIRGAFRLELFKLAFKISTYLNKLQPSINSRIFIARSKFFDLFQSINQPCYWYVTASQYREALGLCDEIANLLDELDFNDARVVELAVDLLMFTLNEHKNLVNKCWQHIHKIEALYPEAAHQLKAIFDTSYKPTDSVYSESIKAKKDLNYKNSLISEIAQSNEITPEQFEIFRRVANPESIASWLKNGEIKTDSRLENDFCLLELTILACCDDNPDSKRKIEKQASNFLAHKQEISRINPLRIITVVEQLYRLRLCSINCNLLELLIPDSDLWVSPPVQFYLQSLLACEQIYSLQQTLAKIPEAERIDTVHAVIAGQYEVLHQFNDAVNAIETAIMLNSLVPDYWWQLFLLHQRINSDQNSLKEIADRVPIEIFANYSPNTISLLYQVAKFGNFKMAEETLVRWFLENPDQLAVPLTSFEFSRITEHISCDHIILSQSIEGCLGGVVYMDEKQKLTKLLVDGSSSSTHSSFLLNTSNLAESLSAMQINESRIIKSRKVKLIERLPAYIAVHRVATELRAARNDDNDVFVSLSIPEKPDELVSFLEERLFSTNQKQPNSLFDDNIPLFMKWRQLNKSDMAQCALELLSTPNVKKSLYAYGEEIADKVILDIYSILYLAITGLSDGLQAAEVKVVITLETQDLINAWLTSINREDYLSLGKHPSGGLLRITADDIKKQTLDIQQRINAILTVAEVEPPKLLNIPVLLSNISEALDSSVFSSLKLSITNSIPWLCIDEYFARNDCSQAFGYRVGNMLQFLKKLAENLSFENRKIAIYELAYRKLPFPLMLNDVLELSKQGSEEDNYALAQLITMHPHGYPDITQCIHFLSEIIKNVLICSYHNGALDMCLKSKPSASSNYMQFVINACCFVVIQQKNEQDAEFRLALLIKCLFNKFSNNKEIEKIIAWLIIPFIKGHFLNMQVIDEYLQKMNSTR